MPKTKLYVGLTGSKREVFRFAQDPTENDGLPYNAVIGPFRSKRGAKAMVHYGQGNPHMQHVNDAERIGKKYAEDLAKLGDSN